MPSDSVIVFKKLNANDSKIEFLLPKYNEEYGWQREILSTILKSVFLAILQHLTFESVSLDKRLVLLMC